ncbi:MAG TPA: OPT family oligopeptide transporter, partial [Burkholderiaceae bacterium]|nr:OPT family oligopeptide transporter [Burkholderiaceae bacterium]
MRETRELTARALATGVVLGALLAPCNVYSGLRIGWSFNMSIIALLASIALWRPLARVFGLREWNRLESNIGQTTASSAASIVSGGLVAPIPAYTLITGQQLALAPLIAWVFAVSLLGIWVAWYLRPALVGPASQLRFPEGLATLETLLDVFAHGAEASRRIAALGLAALLSAATRWVDTFLLLLPRWTPVEGLARFTFVFEPSWLLAGFGAIIGLRVGLSLFAGALLAWGLIAPRIAGSVVALPDGDADASLFGPLVEWLLWPGVSLMVGATLSSFAVGLWRTRRSASTGAGAHAAGPRRWLGWRAIGDAPVPALAFGAAALLTVLLQRLLFGIDWWIALLAVPLAVMLATVAARVVGDTGIPPIGAIGKVSQLSFGLAAPGQAVTNLMTANVAGGAAGQCADLMNDFLVGRGIGASPARQAVAQSIGVVTGSVVGALVYLTLIPDPAAMLLTEQWPAPAVATWKAVAEAMAHGLDSVPASARAAMVIALLVGAIAGLLEASLPARFARRLPSATAFGLAFVIPASISLTMTAGALAAAA